MSRTLEGFRHLLHRCRERLPSRPLVIANVLSGRDVFRLLPAQRQRFVLSTSLDRPVLVPAKSVRFGMTGRYRRRSMVISFAETEKHLRPIASLPTFIFLDEIIRHRKDLQETVLYKQVMSGERVRRQHSSNGQKHRGQLVTDDELVRYYERCMALTESIRRQGVIPLDSPEGSKFRSSDGEDKDIGVAIDEEGRIIHYRRGKHRLAIAQALGLNRVPVVVHFISGRYLLKFMRKRDLFMPGRLHAAICQAVDHAVAAAEGLPLVSAVDEPDALKSLHRSRDQFRPDTHANSPINS